MRVLIDGEPFDEGRAAISVFDWAVLRGYGAFELLRSYRGIPFRVEDHIARLGRSLDLLRLPQVDPEAVESWVRRQAAVGHDAVGSDCFVRVVVTTGSRDAFVAAPGRVIVLWEVFPDEPDEFRFLPLWAPWHAGGDYSELTGAKTLSYAPNMAATLEARRQGFHDALLTARDGWVLEGPTFSVCWMKDGVLVFPDLDLGMLASITREVAVEAAARLGLEVRTGRFLLDEVLAADEVIALSTIKEVAPVVAIGEHDLPVGPVTAKLATVFHDLVEAEIGDQQPAAY